MVFKFKEPDQETTKSSQLAKTMFDILKGSECPEKFIFREFWCNVAGRQTFHLWVESEHCYICRCGCESKLIM